MDIKDSYLHGTVGVVKSISVSADKLKYKLADIAGTVKEVTLPVATTSANGLMSSGDKTKLDNLSTTLGNYVTLNTDQDITGTKTFTKQLKFTVAKGTAPFLVTSDTKVDNLNADMLDGLDSSRYLHSVAYDANLDFNVVKGINANGGCVNNANYILSGDNQLSNSPYSYGIMTTLNNGAAGMDFATNGPLGFTIGLKFRKRWLNNLSEWKTVAFTDSDITGNAATATHASTADKLKTKRKLWGLDFDGTADVNGTITFSGGLTNNKSIQFLGGEFFDRYGNFYLDGTNEAANSFNISKTNTDGTDTPLFTLRENKEASFYGTLTTPTFQGNLDGTYVNKLTGYSKATTAAALTATDPLNTALGKLEYKADVAYDLVKGAYDGDGTIENLAEILKVLEGIKDTETIQAIIGKYLPLTGGTLTGSLSVQDASINVRSDKSLLRFLSFGDVTYIESGNAAFNDNAPLKITGYNGFTGSDLYLLFNHIYCRGGNYTNLDSGNTYINNGTITINGNSITPLTSHQSLANYVTLNTDLTITGVKTFSSLQKFTVALGTSPFLVTSNTIVSNLNANYINGYPSSQIFKELGWNNSAAFIDCNNTGRSYGIIINLKGNYTDVINYPHSYGFVLNFLPGGNSYTGVQISIKEDGSDIKIRDRWSSGSWNEWRTLIHNGNYDSYFGYIGRTKVQKNEAIQSLIGINSISMTGAINIYNPGEGTYNRAVIMPLDAEGQFSIEAPLKTDSSTAAKSPIVLTWRGGYSTKGGLKLTGGTDGYLGGKKILHEGNYSSYLALSNAATADQLKTPRLLWGQSFDGTANVSGNMTGVGIVNSIFEVSKGSGNAKLNATSISSDRDYLSLYVSSNTSTNTTTRPLVIQHGYGNVGIGVIAPSEKLEVNGNVKATKFITTGGTSANFVKGDGSLDSNTYATTSSLGNYLPLSGGTLTNTGNPLIIKRIDSNAPGLVFYHNDALLGSLGITLAYEPYIYRANTGHICKIWHEENDGAGSGLAADVLEGTLIANKSTNTCYSNLNLKWYNNINTVSGYAGDNTGFPVSNNANGLLWLGVHNNYGGQLGISSDSRLYYRFVNYGSFPTNANGASWKKLAFTSDLPTFAGGRRYVLSKSATMNTTLLTWYLKIELYAYARPSHIVIKGDYNNCMDEIIIDPAGFNLGYIYRNNNQNSGNVTDVWFEHVRNATTNKWTFWLKLSAIQDSTTSHYSPSSSATYTVYLSDNAWGLDVTATTTAPSNPDWVYVKGTNLVIKNANLWGNASTSTKLLSKTIVNDKSFSLSNTSWTNTGYTFENLTSGTYAIQVTCGNLVASGIMSVYKNIDDTAGDEIPLHVYHDSTQPWRPYLRTSGNKLLISSNDASATSRKVTIKIALIL